MKKPLEKTAQVPLPENWNQTHYLEKVLMNGWSQQAVFAATYPSRWALLKNMFDIISSLKIGAIAKKEPYAAAMTEHAAQSWLAAAQVFLLGKQTETYPIIRMSIEAAALAFSFIQEPLLLKHWKDTLSEDTETTKEAKKALRKGMYADNMEPRLQNAGDEILNEYKRISTTCNESGSHANPLAVTSRFIHKDGRIIVAPTPIDTPSQLYVLSVLITAGALIFNLSLACSGERNSEIEEEILKILEGLAADVTSPESEKFIADTTAEISAIAARIKV